uniref:Uncharacterized protein n=2 Tax=Chenopodium quinoa TaxID=63459 RepID=A0A803M0D0_CHEQI
MNFPVNTTSDNDLLVSPDSMTDNKINETMAGIAREYSSVLNYLVTIDLSNNDLVGVIPKELTKLFGVIALNLANNSFTGTIPGNIGDMKALETLDLSENKLYGRIPTSLGYLNFLNHLNLSFNNLSGPIPTSTQLQTLNDPSIYTGNPYLCGDPLPKCLSHDEKPNHSDNQDDEEKTNKLEMMWFYLDVMLGFATGFWGVVGTLLLNKRWRHALFRCVEDASNWLYVAIALKVSKLKKMMIKRDNSNE